LECTRTQWPTLRRDTWRGGEDFRDAKRSGRPKTNRTEEKIAAVHMAINEKASISMLSLSKKFDVPETSMRRIVNDDLQLKSLVKIRV